MARRTHCHTATRAFYGQFIALTKLHHVHVHIRGRFELMLHPFSINDCYIYYIIHSDDERKLEAIHTIDGGVLQDIVFIRINSLECTLHHKGGLVESAQNQF